MDFFSGLSECDEEAQLTPKESEHPGVEITHTEIATMYTKTAKMKQC